MRNNLFHCLYFTILKYRIYSLPVKWLSGNTILLMKLKYNKKDDVLMIELNKEQIDYAEQSGDLIVHFSPKREAVLLEILDASQFLRDTTKMLPKSVREEISSTSTSITHRIK